MNQEKYDLIVKAIRYSIPMQADDLISALNGVIQLANDRLKELNTVKSNNTSSTDSTTEEEQ